MLKYDASHEHELDSYLAKRMPYMQRVEGTAGGRFDH